MHSRKINKELIISHAKFYELCFAAFADFDIHSIEKALSYQEQILSLTSQWQLIETGEVDITYFKSLHYIINSVFQLLQSFQMQLTANANAGPKQNASNANASMFLDLVKKMDSGRPSIQSLTKIAGLIKTATVITDLPPIISSMFTISLPAVFTTEYDRYHKIKNEEANESSTEIEKVEEGLLISVRFYFDQELWANPQMIKPNLQYSLRGTIRVNNWPSNYTHLILSPVSTTNDEHYILSLPEIEYTGNNEIEIIGSVILKYAQPLYEKPLSIKLFARYKGNDKISLYPLIIGYDQLIVKVIDTDSYLFPTGYNKLNQKVFEIVSQIRQKLPALPDKELEHFHILLSAILNYQGYCAEHGEYQETTNFLENDFRNYLIRYLSAIPELAGSIVKEGQIAGGRVEIRFNEIIAELKVEVALSDRQKIMDKYQKQPVAYAAATSAELSILCILDLTSKTRPPAIAARNVFLQTVQLHGFEDTGTNSLVAVVFIDGNTPKPSKYRS